jgi:transcriptional regulator with XRE-family HTH domain
MREDQRMPGFTPATPRSRRLGRELRRLRDAKGLTLEQAGKRISSSPSRVQRIEAGDIRPRPGDVMELLQAYEIPLEGEEGTALILMARELREQGWWQRFDALPSRYATMIAYEDEATDIRTYQPTLVPGLLQTEAYARAVIGTTQEIESQALDQLVAARLQRQGILARKAGRPRLRAVVAEAALLMQVGGSKVMREQLIHLAKMAEQPNITVQVITFEAGAHMAGNGSFVLLSGHDEPALGYIETLAGNLFIEAPREVRRLELAWAQLSALARSPAESARLIKERSSEMV